MPARGSDREIQGLNASGATRRDANPGLPVAPSETVCVPEYRDAPIFFGSPLRVGFGPTRKNPMA
jgi:hypothetical protein